MMMDRESLSEWAKDKPLSILQLDPADRAVLRIAGKAPACVSFRRLIVSCRRYLRFLIAQDCDRKMLEMLASLG